MIPLRDRTPSDNRPIGTWVLLALLVVGYIMQFAWPEMPDRFGLIPDSLPEAGWMALVTHIVVHATPLHLIGNAVFLFAFGPAVESALGSKRMLVIFVLGGIAGGLAKWMVDPTSNLPMVGASGSISAVLAAAVVLGPKRRILTWTPYLILIQLLEVPTWIFVVVWLGLQLTLVYLTLGADLTTSPFAHLGGFLAGMALAYAFVLRQNTRPKPDEPG